ncbi:MAG: hypothetical protein WCG20_01560 [bacterium]
MIKLRALTEKVRNYFKDPLFLSKWDMYSHYGKVERSKLKMIGIPTHFYINWNPYSTSIHLLKEDFLANIYPFTHIAKSSDFKVSLRSPDRNTEKNIADALSGSSYPERLENALGSFIRKVTLLRLKLTM